MTAEPEICLYFRLIRTNTKLSEQIIKGQNKVNKKSQKSFDMLIILRIITVMSI